LSPDTGATEVTAVTGSDGTASLSLVADGYKLTAGAYSGMCPAQWSNDGTQCTTTINVGGNAATEFDVSYALLFP
jgi:hypothetical protein